MTCQAFCTPAGTAAGSAGFYLAPTTEETSSKGISQRLWQDSITLKNPFLHKSNILGKDATLFRKKNSNATADFEPLIKVKKECKKNTMLQT